MYVWLQNIDGIMLARHYDMSNNSHAEHYRPIPVHTPTANRRLSNSKTYPMSVSGSGTTKRAMGRNNTPESGGTGLPNSSHNLPMPLPPHSIIPTSAPSCTNVRYDTTYDYRPTHYPSYPANYPCDEEKYKHYDDSGNAYNGYEFYEGYGSAPATMAPVTATTAAVQCYDGPGYDPRPPGNGNHHHLQSYHQPEQEYSRYDEFYSANNSANAYAERGNYNHSNNTHNNDNDTYGYERSSAQPSPSPYLYPTTENGRSNNNSAICERSVVRDHRNLHHHQHQQYHRDRHLSLSGGRIESSRSHRSVSDTGRFEGRHKENYYDRYYKHRPARDFRVTDSTKYNRGVIEED